MLLVDFLEKIDPNIKNSLDRALAVLWWTEKNNPSLGLSIKEINKAIEGSGHPKQNPTRLGQNLAIEKRACHVPNNKNWKLTPSGFRELDALYGALIEQPIAPKPSDSILPRNLFSGLNRSYLLKIVTQINSSYDAGLYDCSAVMCRRLLETLIIEVYEAKNKSTEIRGADENYLMLAEMLKVFLADKNLQLSRNGRRGAENAKKIGDLSAHNRKFNAQKPDIDGYMIDFRVACEELLHMAGLAPGGIPE